MRALIPERPVVPHKVPARLAGAGLPARLVGTENHSRRKEGGKVSALSSHIVYRLVTRGPSTAGWAPHTRARLHKAGTEVQVWCPLQAPADHATASPSPSARPHSRSVQCPPQPTSTASPQPISTESGLSPMSPLCYAAARWFQGHQPPSAACRHLGG